MHTQMADGVRCLSRHCSCCSNWMGHSMFGNGFSSSPSIHTLVSVLLFVEQIILSCWGPVDAA